VSQPSSASRPLQFTPTFWVALLLVALIGLNQLLRSPSRSRLLGYLEEDEPLVIRQHGDVYRFPRLGVEVAVDDGWNYLSVAEDSEAFEPTFVHPASHTIIRLQPFHLQSWPPQGLALQSEEVGSFQIEWVVVNDLRLGRLRRSSVDLAIIAMTHQRGAPLNQAIQDFCHRIQHLREEPPSARAASGGIASIVTVIPIHLGFRRFSRTGLSTR
jgi:hypothetical protein